MKIENDFGILNYISIHICKITYKIRYMKIILSWNIV